MTDTNRPAPRLLARVRPWMVALALMLVYLSVIFALNHGDRMAFLFMPQPPSPEHPEGTEGYDGQFVYAIARDPLTSIPYLDVPAYRLQRILLPVLAHLLAFGQEPLIPWTLLLIDLASYVAGMIILERLLEAEGVSPWWALVYGLSAGIFMSVRLSLTEPLAYALVIAAIWLDRQNHPWWSAVSFALAGLAKEPTLIFAGAYMLWMVFERRGWDAVRLGIVAWVPFIAWQGVLVAWLGSPGVGPGGGLRTPFEIIPYFGFWRIYTTTGSLEVLAIFAGVFGPMVILPSVWGIVRSLLDFVRRVWHPYVFALLANAAVVAIIPYSTFREPLGILRLIPGLTIAWLLYAARYRRQSMMRFSLLWLGTLAFAIVSG
jgi:hypothetical protein